MNITIPCISMRHLTPATRLSFMQVSWAYESLAGTVSSCEENIFLRGLNSGYFDLLPQDLQAILSTIDAPFGWILLSVDGDVDPRLPTYN